MPPLRRQHAHVHTAGGDGRRAEGFIIIADFGAEGLLLNTRAMWGLRNRLLNRGTLMGKLHGAHDYRLMSSQPDCC